MSDKTAEREYGVIVEIFDNTACQLGEGVLWHPERGCLFWVDINSQTLFHRSDGQTSTCHFKTPISAAGWIDRDHLLLASDEALLRFNINSRAVETICLLEADNPLTRANDGRADPWGGFWIGTMGRKAEPDAGAIYRYYCGELRRLYAPITIPNAICFPPSADFAYFADTMHSMVWRQTLDSKNGWPRGEPEVFLDLSNAKLFPDGAVCDAEGYFWNAQWGSARVARYRPDGSFDMQISLPTDHVTCLGFGGAALDQVFVTTAIVGLDKAQRTVQPNAGKTFRIKTPCFGQQEKQVQL